VLVVAILVRLGVHASGLAVFALGAGAATLWCVAAEICRRRFDIGTVDRRRMALALLSFAFAAGDRTAGRLRLTHDTTSWAFTCGRAVALVGWCLLLAVALRSLVNARAQNRRRQQQLRGARDDVVRGWADEQQRFDQRRHDTRSLVAGIQGATTTLTRYRDFLDPREQHELESALVGEIQRLQHAVSPGSSEPGHFTLEAAVGPVIMAERARGTVVNSFLTDVEVLGSADATAAVVQNLVTNARRHAPGSVITVAADIVGTELRLAVDDDGPGLPAPVRQRVMALFAEGAARPRSVPDPRRGDGANTAVGRRSGLGLTICSRLAREQGGRLRVADTDVGTRIELLLPLALGAEPCPTQSDASR
jgi:signal transduction histidine kinase